MTCATSQRSLLTSWTDEYEIPVGDIHLEFGGKELHNGDSLAEHGIKYGSVISACSSGRYPGVK
jgi:hypothetical protein